MANELMKIEVPENMLALLQEHPELAGLMQELATGTSSGPTYPQIKLKGTRFRMVDGDLDQVLKTTEIKVAILRAKEKPERRYYIKPYVEGEEQVPDCESENGITPDADCVCPQNTSCAGCRHNVWGTGTKADGTPSGGKACKERKLITVAPVDKDGVVFEKAFGLSIPPTSLTPYGNYIDQLKLHGIKIPALVITTIGFADANHPILTFAYGGTLSPVEAGKAIKLMTAPETVGIITVGSTPPALSAPVVASAPPVTLIPEPGVVNPEVIPPPADSPKKKGRPVKTVTTSPFGETTEIPQEPKEPTDNADPAAVAKALGIPFE